MKGHERSIPKSEIDLTKECTRVDNHNYKLGGCNKTAGNSALS